MAAAFVLLLLVLVAVSTPSSGATYCVCKSGVSDQSMQTAIDYACGSGADCSAILQNGACYSPNTVKNHCDYAVNSYFQKKGQVNGSCDFAGTATPSASVPAEATGCVYPASSQAATTSTPSTTTTTSTGVNSTTPTPTYSLGPTSTSTTGTVYAPNSHSTVAKSSIALILPPVFSLLWGL